MISNKKLLVKSPFDQQIIKEVKLLNFSEAENQLIIAKQLFDKRENWIPAYQRISILERLVVLMHDSEELLILTATKEGGKPYQDSKIEIQRAISGIKIALNEIGNIKGEQVPMGLTPSSSNRLAFTVREPIGVVFAISAFNHPLNLIVHQTISAFAAGCPVIIKPASTTPLSCLLFCELLNKAGVPEGWIQALICENDVSEKIALDPRISFLSFIGSSKVGWYLKSKLAPGTRCGLEHGGIAPVIVEDDVVIDDIIEALCIGGFYHAGQVCVSVQRIFAHEKIARKLAERLAEKAKTLKVGDPLDPKTEVGPIISLKELDRIHAWVTESKIEGAEILCGGEKIYEYCYLPTVIWNPNLLSKVSQEEIFGPIICITPYQTLDEAIGYANDVKYHFQSSIFTPNLDKALKCIQEINASTVLVNDHTAFRVDWMPFGGRDLSGEGMGGIPYMVHELTRLKLLIFKSNNIN